MSIRSCIRSMAGPRLVAMLLAAGAAQAQTTPPRLTDVGPPPAEERDSTGAVVLENSLVRAQRNKAVAESSTPTGMGTVGRGASGATSRARTRAELASAREAEAAEFYRRGAGALTGR